MAAAKVMAGQADFAIGGGVESMSRVAMGSDGGAWATDPPIAIKSYFAPQGIGADLIATKYGFSRDDVDAYRGRKPEARRRGLEGRPVQEVGRAGEGHQLGADDARSRRAHAARHHDAVAGRAQAVVRAAGRAMRLRCGGACSAIRRSSASTTCTTPAIRRASSTARPPC